MLLRGWKQKVSDNLFSFGIWSRLVLNKLLISENAVFFVVDILKGFAVWANTARNLILFLSRMVGSILGLRTVNMQFQPEKYSLREALHAHRIFWSRSTAW